MSFAAALSWRTVFAASLQCRASGPIGHLLDAQKSTDLPRSTALHKSRRGEHNATAPLAACDDVTTQSIRFLALTSRGSMSCVPTLASN